MQIKSIHLYVKNLTVSRMVLWCYLFWYLTIVRFYFVPTPRLWLTSLGISALIGTAFLFNTASGQKPVKVDSWQLFRLYLIPFCVSSFSSLVKDRGFVLIFSPRWEETTLAMLLCAGFLAMVTLVRCIGQLQEKL